MSEKKDDAFEGPKPSGGQKGKRGRKTLASEGKETKEQIAEKEKVSKREQYREEILSRLREHGFPLTEESAIESLMMHYEAETKVNALLSKLGRPTMYHPILCEWAVWLGKRGYSVRQIAVMFDVSHETLYLWSRNFPDFHDALSRAREGAQHWWETIGQAAVFSKQFQFGLWNKIVSSRFKADYVDQRALPYDPTKVKEENQQKLIVLDPADLTLEQKEAVLTAIEAARQKEEE